MSNSFFLPSQGEHLSNSANKCQRHNLLAQGSGCVLKLLMVEVVFQVNNVCLLFELLQGSFHNVKWIAFPFADDQTRQVSWSGCPLLMTAT